MVSRRLWLLDSLGAWPSLMGAWIVFGTVQRMIRLKVSLQLFTSSYCKLKKYVFGTFLKGHRTYAVPDQGASGLYGGL